MNATELRPAVWSRTRWWSLFAVVMTAQMALVAVLSDRKPVEPRQAATLPAVHFAARPAPGSALGELLEVRDPTLYALPHRRGFSGPAWMETEPMTHRAADWTEPPRWLAMSGDELGATFLEFVRTNRMPQRLAAEKPAVLVSEIAVPPVPLRAKSSVHLEGDLASRDLLRALEVPSIAHTDILSNTVIQMSVNAAGHAASVVVLAGSGSKPADQRALELARTARFKPVRAAAGAEAWTWGRMIFQWHTTEMPATNVPAVKPSS